MPLIIRETINSRVIKTDAKSPAASLEYIVVGSDDSETVTAGVLGVAPTTYGGMSRQSVDPKPSGGGVWIVGVEYQSADINPEPIDPDEIDPETGQPKEQQEPGDDEPLGPDFTMSTSAGTQHITRSRLTVTSLGRNAEDFPDDPPVPNYRGLIGVTTDAIEGCDVPVGQGEFSYTRYFTKITPALSRTWEVNIGKTNSKKFIGREIGECQYLGVETSKWVQGYGFPVRFKFASGANVFFEADEIPDFASFTKRAFDYLWAEYVDEKDPDIGRMVPRARYLFVERVTGELDFRKVLRC